MQQEKRKTRQENSDSRRSDLIAATLAVIAREGVKSATVRTIAKEADVTQGLIRYYFSSKDELIATAYETYMGDLVMAADQASCQTGSAAMRLAKFIQASLTQPVTSPEAVSIWAGFFEILLHDPTMHAHHKRSYDLLRLHLKKLIGDIYAEQQRTIEPAQLRRLSIAGNAILDGLWIEGGALPDAFEKDELVLVGLESFGALLNINLTDLDLS